MHRSALFATFARRGKRRDGKNSDGRQEETLETWLKSHPGHLSNLTDNTYHITILYIYIYSYLLLVNIAYAQLHNNIIDMHTHVCAGVRSAFYCDIYIYIY